MFRINKREGKAMKQFVWPADRKKIERYFRVGEEMPAEVLKSVEKIIASVRRQGDAAVARWTRQFDRVTIPARKFEVKKTELRAAERALDPKLREALMLASKRIEAFHRRQRLKGWAYEDPKLGRLEMRVQPLDRIGVYAPGGKAAYPSTVLMDVIPAKVAGVGEVIVVTPPQADGEADRRTLAAASLAGADRVFRLGGAQALAALAYGTKTIPRVDKIVGPGNVYVAAAKKALFGQVDIDMIAGPTEVLIVADARTRLDWIAADMLAQAEHDEDASSIAILIDCDAAWAKELASEVNRQLRLMPRNKVAGASIRRHAAIIRVRTVEEAIDLVNQKAPEHVEVLCRNARRIASKITHAGAIFIGPHTPEPVGDYIAGPNHTLPTGGTARFFSPLSVWSFYKTCHTIEATEKGLAGLRDAIETLAEAEGLTGHAESVRSRFR
jgi:histidinol dehydrogenase